MKLKHFLRRCFLLYSIYYTILSYILVLNTEFLFVTYLCENSRIITIYFWKSQIHTECHNVPKTNSLFENMMS